VAKVVFWSALQNSFLLAQRYIGPYQLAHWLRKHGYSTQVIDFVVKGSQAKYKVSTLWNLTEKFVSDETLVLGVSSTFFMKREFPDNIAKVLKKVRKKYPNIKLVLGGNKAETYSPEITALFDCVVVGLAEDILLELVEFCDTGTGEPKGVRELPHKVKFYRESNQTRFNIEECDHKWADNDLIMPGETLPLEISRGCIFKCKFCQYPLLGRSKNDYTRKMEHIRAELVDNYERFGTTNYYLLDDTFNDTVDKVKSFYEMTQTLPFQIRYATYLRADLLHRFPETIQMLKDSGLRGAHFGIETFHPEMSKLIGKGWSGKHAKEWLPWLIHEAWNDEVVIHISMIVGLAREDGVTETVEDLQESSKWFLENKIGSWNFKPLGIEKYDGRAFSSEFSLNADKYGYYHPDDERYGYWQHKATRWTYDNATYIAKDILNKQRRGLKWDSWGAISMMTLGYEWDHVRTAKRSSFSKDEMRERATIWFKTYYQRLLDL
jgi:radical SAM superfamily enzyme YgiQ (UPF0313 family)